MSFRYLAYGSNLWVPQMRSRCPSATPLSTATIEGWRLPYDKPSTDGSAKLNLRPDPSSTVEGVVYRLADEDRAALDAAEPLYSAIDVTAGGEKALAYVYEGDPTETAPYDWYVTTASLGAASHGIDVPYRAHGRPDPLAPGLRPATSADLPLIQSILSRGLAAGTPRYFIHPGEFAWWVYHDDPRHPDHLDLDSGGHRTCHRRLADTPRGLCLHHARQRSDATDRLGPATARRPRRDRVSLRHRPRPGGELGESWLPAHLRQPALPMGSHSRTASPRSTAGLAASPDGRRGRSQCPSGRVSRRLPVDHARRHAAAAISRLDAIAGLSARARSGRSRPRRPRRGLHALVARRLGSGPNRAVRHPSRLPAQGDRPRPHLPRPGRDAGCRDAHGAVVADSDGPAGQFYQGVGFEEAGTLQWWSEPLAV